jgi:hypothetical protein
VTKRKIADLQSAIHASTDQTEEDDWSLTVEQMLFMMQHNNEVEIAFEEDDDEYFDTLVESGDYKALFGDMGIDEALDRYECALEPTITPRPKPGVNASPHLVTEVERPPKEEPQSKTS